MEKQKLGRPIWCVAMIISCAACVVFLSRAMSNSGGTAPLVASLDLPENVRDLGRTSTRQEWQVPFRIGNAGARRLVINEVDACCGPQDPIGQTVIIPPGETVDVTVTLDTRWASGPVEQIASFTSSDPAHPRFDLTVRASVNPDEMVAGSGADQRRQTSVLVRQKR